MPLYGVLSYIYTMLQFSSNHTSKSAEYLHQCKYEIHFKLFSEQEVNTVFHF